MVGRELAGNDTMRLAMPATASPALDRDTGVDRAHRA
jgi:hypothetical protein